MKLYLIPNGQFHHHSPGYFAVFHFDLTGIVLRFMSYSAPRIHPETELDMLRFLNQELKLDGAVRYQDG
jgi:hypothetical protein